jgi:hypothetical protein
MLNRYCVSPLFFFVVAFVFFVSLFVGAVSG